MRGRFYRRSWGDGGVECVWSGGVIRVIEWVLSSSESSVQPELNRWATGCCWAKHATCKHDDGTTLSDGMAESGSVQVEWVLGMRIQLKLISSVIGVVRRVNLFTLYLILLLTSMSDLETLQAQFCKIYRRIVDIYAHTFSLNLQGWTIRKP